MTATIPSCTSCIGSKILLVRISGLLPLSPHTDLPKPSPLAAGIFSENEQAAVIKEIRMIDPAFNPDEFRKEMQDYVIPEVLESFLHGNRNELREWCSEGAFSVLNATIEEREKGGLHVDSKILELKHVDVGAPSLLPALYVLFERIFAL